MRTANYASEKTLDKKAETWLETIRKRTAPRPRLKLDPGRSALLVIDMLIYFADPKGRCFLPAARSIIPRVMALVEAWRCCGAPVLFTRHCHSGESDLGMLGKFFGDYIKKGEPQAEIVPELAPGAEEPVIQKTTYDAFFGTNLDLLLEERGVDQILVTGVLTHMCCETTARSAFCRGFEVYVPVDAVASSSEDLHLGSLLSMADSVAVMMSTDEALKLCAKKR